MKVEVESVLGEAAGSAVGGAAKACFALCAAEEAEVTGGVLVLSVGAVGRTKVGGIP